MNEASWRIGDVPVRAAGGSVTGDHYDANYDRFHLDPSSPLAVVADGMGSGEGSAAAGRLAVETVVHAAGAEGRTPAAMRAATAEAHVRVREKARDLRELTGCTLTALAGVPGSDGGATARIAQLGDSRVYRLRGGLLELLTVDHTWAWLAAVHGWWAADSAEARAARYRLTRYVGHPDEPEPDVLDVTLRTGDTLLLCTDGVSDQLSYDEIAAALAPRNPVTAVSALLAATLTAGGADNATAIVLVV
ncbi:protein phosphatase 2C domain-containing protein [Actinoplanes sp. NPDC051851]|uniref:PP2C family protein-serine/threonine phosphatase n=1 Tax=Actinoplanes sp. NPDC051851 TaxID=3154753 RepID=UPI0034398A2E